MPSYINVNNIPYELVQLKEKANYEIHGTMRKALNAIYSYENLLKNINVIIERNFVDDTFSVLGPYTAKSNASPNEGPFVSVNNEVTLYQDSGLRANDVTNYLDARHFDIKDIKFRDVTSWTKGFVESSNGNNGKSIVSIFPHFENFVKSAKITSNQVLEIDLIKDVKFRPWLDFSPLLWNVVGEGFNFNTSSNSSINKQYYIDEYYYHLFVVPKQIDNLKQQVSIADIYMYGDRGESPAIWEELMRYQTFGFNNSLKYSSTSFAGDSNITFSEDFRKANDIDLGNIFEARDIYKIGSLDFQNQTYYDYEKGKTILGLDGTSRPGELIPFNFDGMLNREFSLGIVDFLKDFKLSISNEIKQKTLDPYSGKIKLIVNDNSHSPVTNLVVFSGKQLQLFRDALKSQPNIPIEGIKRFKDE